MNLHKLRAAIAAAALLSAATFGDAVAQSIRHEVNGQVQTFDFKQKQSASAPDGQPTAARTPRKPRSSAELQRGSRSIPWDEPGKITGVPGIDEKSATSLPALRVARPKASSAARRAQADAQKPSDAQDPDVGHAQDGPPGRSTEAAWDSQPRQNQPGEPAKPAPAQAPRPGTLPDSGAAEDGKPRSDEAEARARIIADARARALAEEQRRLELERSKDRHARRLEPPLPAAVIASPGAPAAAQMDPVSTGTIATSRKTSGPDALDGPRTGEAQSNETPGLRPDVATVARPASWLGSVCRSVFFGILPGC